MQTPNAANVLGPIHLRDGTPVLARALVPDDRAALAKAYQLLSPASRYNRFWTHGGDVIGERMLDRVLLQDPSTHITWAVLDPSREFTPMGAASWWRDDATSAEAEVSAVVLDDDQGRGIGTLLLAILWCLARRVGIRELIGYGLVENRKAADWMRDTGATGHWDGYKLIFRWQLDSSDPPPPETACAKDLHSRIRELTPALCGCA